MDKRLKAKWVKALRSGKFKQTREALERIKDDQRHKHLKAGNCCLGVLCRVAGLKPTEPVNDELNFIYGQLKTGGGCFPEGLQAHFGLTEEQHERLWKMNDGDGVTRKTFRGIATWIEKNL